MRWHTRVSTRPRLSRASRGARDPQISHFVMGLVTYLRRRSNRAPNAWHEAAIDTTAPFQAAPAEAATPEAALAEAALAEAALAQAAPSQAMRVLHLAQSDRGGGANKAAFRLHRALNDLG